MISKFNNREVKRKEIIAFNLLIAIYFYSSGNFGLTNIFGYRREIQFILLLTIFIGFSILIKHIRVKLTNPVLIFSLTSVLFAIVNIDIWLSVVSFLISILLVLVILNETKSEIRSLIWMIAGLSFVFSLFAFFQLIYFWLYLSYVPGLMGGYSSGMLAEKVRISHPIQYLGFIDTLRSIYLFGIRVPRFYSYAPEPSVLAYSFLAPAFAGMFFKGRIRVFSFVILAFILFLAQSGTLWLAFFMSAVLFLLFNTFKRIIKKRSKQFALIVMFLIPLFFYSLSNFGLSSVVSTFFYDNQSWIGEISTIAGTKENSARERIFYMEEGWRIVLANPLGYHGNFKTVGGALLVHYGLFGGFLGIGVVAYLFYHIVAKLGNAFYLNEGFLKKWSIAGLLGVIFVAVFFSGYGWYTTPGIVMLAIIFKLADMSRIIGDEL